MAPHSPDETPPKALAAPAAIALPGGPDGASGPAPPPCAGGLGSGAWRPVPGLVRVTSANEPGPSRPGVDALRGRGSSNGRRRRVAAPAALCGAIGAVAEPCAVDGAGLPVVDATAGTGDEPTAFVAGVTALLEPTGEGDGAVLGVGSTCAVTDVVRFGAAAGATFVGATAGATFVVVDD